MMAPFRRLSQLWKERPGAETQPLQIRMSSPTKLSLEALGVCGSVMTWSVSVFLQLINQIPRRGEERDVGRTACLLLARSLMPCYAKLLGRFYEQLIKTVEDLDEDSFSQTCFDYDQVLSES